MSMAFTRKGIMSKPAASPMSSGRIDRIRLRKDRLRDGAARKAAKLANANGTHMARASLAKNMASLRTPPWKIGGNKLASNVWVIRK
jgi:hypothetical protein